MEGNCLVNDIVCKCDVTRPSPKKVYLGPAEGKQRSRFYNHKFSFKHKRYSNKTTLSNYMWCLKSVSSKTPNLKWSILRCLPTYLNISKKCLSCLYEKLAIFIYQNHEELLNRRSELLCKYSHANKFLLKNYTGNYFRLQIVSNSLKQKKTNCLCSNISLPDCPENVKLRVELSQFIRLFRLYCSVFLHRAMHI